RDWSSDVCSSDLRLLFHAVCLLDMALQDRHEPLDRFPPKEEAADAVHRQTHPDEGRGDGDGAAGYDLSTRPAHTRGSAKDAHPGGHRRVAAKVLPCDRAAASTGEVLRRNRAGAQFAT